MPKPHKFKVALIGCGGRIHPYAKSLHDSGEVEIVACADPSKKNLEDTLTAAGLAAAPVHRYADWRELCEKEKELDGAVISTPNHLHRAPAEALLPRHIPIALEKPIANTMEDAERILEAARIHQGRILLGFVLRSTPFYSKIHKLLEADRIGNIVSIQADELVSCGISSVIARGPWRRYTATSGGSMMEKCSHDMDLLNWFVGARPVAVNSFGGTLLFRPNAALPKKCADCAMQEQCIYYGKPPFHEASADAILESSMDDSKYLCIYNIDKDVFDNQVVSLQYANGVIANFTLAFNTRGERAGRNIHIIGTRGRIWGNIDESVVGVNETLTGRTEHYPIAIDPTACGGHNGGDVNHALELLRMMKDPSYTPVQGPYAGYLSNALCIAADLSATEGRQLRLRYNAEGYISFA